MNMNLTSSTTMLIDRMVEATNRHDLDALADCFHPDYESEFPAHPDRAFHGREQMRQNWSRIFTSVPDLRSVLIRSASNRTTAWAEWEWTGTRVDGEPFEMRGVTIQEVRDGQVAWVRLYMEPVERNAVGLEAAMSGMLGEQRNQ